MLSVLIAGLAGSLRTLPADNGGAPAVGAGDWAPRAVVVCSNASGAGNYSIPLAAEVDGAALVILALQPSDLFTKSMVSNNQSLDAFLQSDATGVRAVGSTSYLFLAYPPAGCGAP